MLTGSLSPVPPVHRTPPDVDGHAVLIGEDPLIESKDPVHIARAKEMRVPQEYREAMERALRLAGFKVVSSKDLPYDVEAKLALHVDESTGKVRQVYRCKLQGSDGSPIAQIDWQWPEGTYVNTAEVYDFATHHLANEVALSRALVAYLRRRPPPGAAPAPDSAVPAREADASADAR
jgi:hypothetical protein